MASHQMCGLRTSVKAVLAKLLGELHEVALDERHLVRKTGLGSLLASAEDLELVVVDTNDVGVRETGNLTGGATNTTADVKNTHARAETSHRGEVVLVTSNGLEEGLALEEAAEVERVTWVGLADVNLTKPCPETHPSRTRKAP